MFSNYLGDKIKAYLAETRVLNGGWVTNTTPKAASTQVTIGGALQRCHAGIPKADLGAADYTPTAGNTMEALANGETCYFLVTVTPAGALKVYQMAIGVDQYDTEAIQDIIDAAEIVIMVLKAVATGAWTALTSNWSGSNAAVTKAVVNGVIPGETPSDLTFA